MFPLKMMKPDGAAETLWTRTELEAALRSGQLKPDSAVMPAGGDSWVPLESLPEFQQWRGLTERKLARGGIGWGITTALLGSVIYILGYHFTHPNPTFGAWAIAVGGLLLGLAAATAAGFGAAWLANRFLTRDGVRRHGSLKWVAAGLIVLGVGSWLGWSMLDGYYHISEKNARGRLSTDVQVDTQNIAHALILGQEITTRTRSEFGLWLKEQFVPEKMGLGAELDQALIRYDRTVIWDAGYSMERIRTNLAGVRECRRALADIEAREDALWSTVTARIEQLDVDEWLKRDLKLIIRGSVRWDDLNQEWYAASHEALAAQDAVLSFMEARLRDGSLVPTDDGGLSTRFTPEDSHEFDRLAESVTTTQARMDRAATAKQQYLDELRTKRDANRERLQQ